MNCLTEPVPRWAVLISYVLITAVFALTASWAHSASTKANHAVARLEANANARVRESCVTAKTRYKAAIVSLTNTYTFLEQSSPEERKSTLDKFIIGALPKQELDLKNLKPSSFCKGIGPAAPPVPQRPADLRKGVQHG